MNTFTRKLKTALVAVMAFCMTACAFPQSSSNTSDNSHNAPTSSINASSGLENSASNSESSSEEDSSSESSSDEESNENEEKRLLAENILNEAFALSVGASLPDTYELSGTVSYIDIDYTSNKGVCLYFNVDEPQERELYCYQLKGAGAELIDSGAYITVSGTLHRREYHVLP